VIRRAGGRRRYNALRTLQAQLRRREVLVLLGEWGLGFGTQARIARELRVSAATVSRDVARLLPAFHACAHCGDLTPRHWADD